MRVVVTGATGFLGGHLVDALLARGHEVIAFARETSRTDGLEALGVRVERGSLLDTGDVARILDGADAVVHAAGGGIAKRVEHIHRANSATTRTLVDAASDLKRFVLVSSLAAHGPSERGRPAREVDSDAPRSHYGRSKHMAEVIALAHQERFGVTALRAPALYGPGEHRLVPLFRAAERGIVPMVHPEGTLSMLHGADCAEAICRALEVEHASGIYYVAEKRIYTRREMARLIGRAVGRDVRLVSLPAGMLKAIGTGAELVGRLRNKAVMLSRDKARDATAKHQACDPSLAMRVLEWRARYDFERGARECYLDYRERGWL